MMLRSFCLLPLLLVSFVSGRAQSADGRTLFTFSGDANGFNPQGGLVQAPDGNFYGTTAGDIADGLSSGTIFRMTPDGAVTTLHTFAKVTGGVAGANADGAQPVATLMVGPDGNLYGVTEFGGTKTANGYSGGTIFRISLSGAFSSLYDFCVTCNSTANPTAPLILGSDGNVYGTTSAQTYPGSIFRLTPEGDLTYVVKFGNYSLLNGAQADGAAQELLEASDGIFYFISLAASTNSCIVDGPNGQENNLCGGVGYVDKSGANLTMDSDTVFTIQSNLEAPSGTQLVEGSNGNMYGATPTGDVSDIGDDVGSAFFVATTPSETISFYPYGTGGSSSSLFLASDGNLYDLGTSSFFQLTPSGTLTSLFAPGASTLGAPIQAADGSFYGTAIAGPATAACGKSPCGVIYHAIMSSGLDGPVQLSFGTSDIPVNSASSLTWKASNAFSNTMQQCFLFSNVNGVITPLGKLAGTLTGNKFGGTVDVTPDAQSIYTYAATCGGTESGFVNVRVGDARATTEMGLTVNSPIQPGTVATVSAGPTTTQYVGPFSGTVTFSAGTLVLGTLTLVNGAASLKVETTNIPPGTYPVTATYSGDVNYLPSTVTVNAIVGYSTTATITASPASFTQGQPFTLSSAVKRADGAGDPTGTVAFYYDSALLGAATLSGGVATLTVDTNTSLPHGIYPITAQYSGDFTDGGSAGNAPAYLNVQAITATTLAASPNPVTADEAFTLTAQVTERYDSSTPTGSITFRLGSSLIGTVALDTSGVAVVSTAGYGISPGMYSVTAAYSGDSSNAASNGTVELTVQ